MVRVEEQAAVVPLSKNVQEMSINGDEPPARYIVKDGSLGPATSSSPLVPIPVIDLSLLSLSSSLSSKEEVDELEKLKSALGTWGCFQVYFLTLPSTFNSKNINK